MEFDQFTVEKKDGYAIVEFDKPPANSYDFDFMRELDDVIEAVRLDDDIHVIILTGGGGKFFSAGADIQMLKESEPGYKAMFCLHCQETLLELERIPKIVIAALDGHCVGGGLEIALACDLRFMARDKGRIGLPEVTLGVLPGTGGTQRLPRLVGKARALEMMITGETYGADDALEMGLVNRVYDADEFWEETEAFAEKLCQGATKAIGLIKVAVQEGLEMPLHGGLALERELQNRLFVTEDAQEGLAAFIEKREPEFQGR